MHAADPTDHVGIFTNNGGIFATHHRPMGPFELQNAGATYQRAILECLHNRIAPEADGWSDASGYMTPSPLTSDSEADGTTAALAPASGHRELDATTFSHGSTSLPQPHT